MNLRGNARLKGELRRKEGDNIFGQASRSAITLTFLVKDSSIQAPATIHYHDIGDYLKRNQKLRKLKEFKSIANTPLKKIEPNKEHDWLIHRNPQYRNFLPLHSTQRCHLFNESSKGMNTARDAWTYNFSKTKLGRNVELTSRFFNDELVRYKAFGNGMSVVNFVERNRTRIAWNREMLRRFEKQIKIEPSVNQCLRLVEYRPFTKTWCYFDPALITVIGKMPRFFSSASSSVRMLCTAGKGAIFPSFWQVKLPTDLNMMSAGANCYPVTIPDVEGEKMFDIKNATTIIENSGPGFSTLKSLYPKLRLDFQDFFNYTYGIFHCPEYIDLFYSNLQKEFPRIPAVATDEEVLTFVDIGAQLSNLHVQYELAEQHPVTETWSSTSMLKNLDDKVKYRVEKMRFLSKKDNSSIQYNQFLKISGIPDEAYEFKVNGKSLVEWVMDRQRISTHKDSDIENDANDFANETMNDPAYPLKLLKKAITVGIKTREIQRAMPPLRIHKKMSGNH